MKWITDNWSFLVVVIAAFAVGSVYVKKFVDTPTAQQILKIKEWLLFAVIQAEKELGSGTGAIKLRYTYNMFVEKFPNMVDMISFALFSNMVDEVLEQMRHLLDTNLDIAMYVEGDDYGSK